MDTYFVTPTAELDSARGVEPALANAAVVGGACCLIYYAKESTDGAAERDPCSC